MHEQQPRLDLARDLFAIDPHRDPHVIQRRSSTMRATARRSARRVSSAARWRLYSALPRWSVTGLQCWAAIVPASAYTSSDGGRPRKACDTAGMPVVLGPTAASPTRASLITPSSSHTATP